MSDIEERVREMLERRSNDIGPDAQRREPPAFTTSTYAARDIGDPMAGPPIRPLTLALCVAATLLLIMGGLLFVANRDEASTAAGTGQRIATEPDVVEDEEPPEGGLPDGDISGEDIVDRETADGEAVDDSTSTIEEFLALFPEAVDVESGSAAYTDYRESTAEGQVASYLNQRLPDLPHSARQVDAVGPLTLFRWSVSQADIDQSGSVLVRRRESRFDSSFSVVAATTDGIELVEAERSLDGMRVVLTDTRTEDLVVDVTTSQGVPIPSSPNPDGIGPADAPLLGTAGSTDGDRFELELAAGPQLVVVRAQNVGGTMLNILEFALDPIGFSEPCGTEAPLTVAVGSLLGPLAVGPSPQAVTAPLTNQQVWHYPGADASIELRWPVDPALIGRTDLTSLGDADVLSFPRSTLGPDGDHVLAILSPSSTQSIVEDPCAILQFSVLGDPAAGEWWSSALSGQLSFGLPLSIAELDPAVGPLGDGSGSGESEDSGSDDSGGQDRVSGTQEATEAPRLPATGSCDGLPNDPPRSGVASQPVVADPAQALAAFVDGPGQAMDPPLGVSGYTALLIDDDNISYVYPPDNPVVVVNVEQTADGWQVTTWEAAPC